MNPYTLIGLNGEQTTVNKKDVLYMKYLNLSWGHHDPNPFYVYLTFQKGFLLLEWRNSSLVFSFISFLFHFHMIWEKLKKEVIKTIYFASFLQDENQLKTFLAFTITNAFCYFSFWIRAAK